jgi:hypothetical protein
MKTHYCTLTLFMLLAFNNTSCQTGNISQQKINEQKIRKMYSTEKKDNSKSIYYIHVNSMQSQFEVFVDDVSVFRWIGDWAGNGGNATIPINSILQQNEQHELKVRMFPLNGETQLDEAYMKVDFYVYPKRNMDEEVRFKTVESHDQLNKELAAKISKLPMYEFRDTFEVSNLPAECEGWKNSVDLSEEDKEQLKTELYDYYNEIHAILKEKNVDSFLKLIEPREKMIDAMHCFDETDIYFRTNEIMSTINSDDEQIQPLPPMEATTLQFYGYGKLVTLLDMKGRGVIQYIDKSENLSALDFRIHRKKLGDKLEVIY